MSAAVPRTPDQIRYELDAAYQRDRELRLGTSEYRENRQHIAHLVKELSRLRTSTHSDDSRPWTWPDSFEQMRVERLRSRAC